MTVIEQITELGARRDALARRLQRLAQEPDPYLVESFEYETWQKASKTRGVITLLLLNAIDTLTAEINQLVFDQPPAARQRSA